MSKLGDHQLLHGQPHGSRRSRQRHDNAAGDEAGAGAGHHRRRADLLVAEHAEQLAKPVEPLFEKRADCLVRAVARGDARSAVGDDHLKAAVRQMAFDCAVNQFGVVPDDRAAGHYMAGGREQFRDSAAADVVVERSRVADSYDETLDGCGPLGLVLGDSHDEDCKGRTVLRDKLLARLKEMGDAPGEIDHQRLAAEVLGIRGAPESLARRLISQALVVGDRRETWQRTGERICRGAPAVPGVYVLRDEEGRALYVGKAVNLRRRLRAHFSDRRWRATSPGFARATDAEWRLVGSEIEALLSEAVLIHELKPVVNIQIGEPDLHTRAVPRALVRDVLVLAPSVEDSAVELVGARVDGGWMIQRTRRDGVDLAVHSARLRKFFAGRDQEKRPSFAHLAPIVFSWLAGRGATATRLDPHGVTSARELRAQLSALLRDERLFTERLMVYS